MFTKKPTLSTDLSTPIPQTTSIIVVVVHFGSPEHTTRLLDSLVSGMRIPDKIVVVNNDSEPYLYKNKHVTCVKPATNRGYIAGLRYGIHSIDMKKNALLVLMNNDAKVSSNFLATIESWWHKHGGSSVLSGPRMATISCFTGRAHINGNHPLFSLPYIDGACMVVRPSFFDAISNVEGLFMYWEDVLLSIHAKKVGGEIKEIPHLGFTHPDNTEEVTDQKLYYLVRNGAYILERLAFPWGLYWIIRNKVRQYWHVVCSGRRHKNIAKALRDVHRVSL